MREGEGSEGEGRGKRGGMSEGGGVRERGGVRE